ncbi:unnamed protein product, partial [Urochloa humidicola]
GAAPEGDGPAAAGGALAGDRRCGRCAGGGQLLRARRRQGAVGEPLRDCGKAPVGGHRRCAVPVSRRRAH